MTSVYGRAVLVCDGRSKRSAAARALPEIERHLRERALDYEVHMAAPGAATGLARRALDAGRRFLVAVGADDTLHGVINGMMEHDRAVVPEAVLGVVSLGRGCDFVRTFGIPTLPGHAVAHLDGPEWFPIDLGKVSCARNGAEEVRYFANMAAVGLGARVAARAPRLPGWLGPASYITALWTTLLHHRPADVVVDLVDRSYEGPLSTLIVANGQFFGDGMKVAPRAAPTDGLLDVLIERTGRLEALALMPQVYRGEHLPHPDIRLAKRVRASITSATRLPVEADGELLGHTPASFEVLPEALRLKV